MAARLPPNVDRGRCVDCNWKMFDNHAWRRLTAEVRTAYRSHGVEQSEARGMCVRCYQARKYNGTLWDFERPTLAAADLLDEWEHFTKSRPTFTANVKAFAEHLGRNYKAVERALNRAGVRAELRAA